MIYNIYLFEGISRLKLKWLQIKGLHMLTCQFWKINVYEEVIDLYSLLMLTKNAKYP